MLLLIFFTTKWTWGFQLRCVLSACKSLVIYLRFHQNETMLKFSRRRRLYDVLTILVPSATRLRMSLTSSPGRTKKFEFFHWLTKNGCAAELKTTKLYASHFTSGPVGGWCKKSKTNGDHSWSIRRNRKSFRVTEVVHHLQRCHSRP